MISIREAIVVEGKYDKIRLQSVVDTVVVETDGFRIFKDKEKLAMLRQLAETRGLVILTDSDSAGFVIRNYLIGTIPSHQIKHAYIPEIEGKERRKSAPSKEGLLGVEGVESEILKQALIKGGVTVGEKNKTVCAGITKMHLYEDGLIGVPDSAGRREKLLKQLGYPQKLSTNRLVEVLNATMTYDEYTALIKHLNE